MADGQSVNEGADDPTTYATAVGAVEPLEDEPVAPVEQHVRRRRRGWLVTGRVFLGLVSAVALAAMTLVYLRVDELDQSKNTTDAVAQAQAGPHAPVVQDEGDGANDILIVGNDSRTDMQGRPLSAKVLRELRTEATETTNTDTLILLRIPENGGRTSAVSIPRDTSVRVEERDRDEKINGVFGITKALAMERMVNGGEKDRAKINRESDDEGRTSLIQAVQGLTGVRVDHYVEVSLYGFYLLTQAIDGVDVCLNHSTSDPDSGASFRRGPQTVRGGDAVSFVRQRKNLPRGDLDRIVRQQVFLSSAMQKVLSGDLLTNNTKLNALEEAVSKTMIMDGGLHFLDLVGLAQTMSSGSVQFVTIPVEAVGARNDRQQSIIVVDQGKVHAFVESLLAPAGQQQPSGMPAGHSDGTADDGTAPVGYAGTSPGVHGGTAPAGYGGTAPAGYVAQPTVPCVD
ncbi:LCP family protein [Actinophytocola oryzae]|uniref:LytR family transcriptional attenuator n=1 Tax=Actinophytocola oryzae TaxID=502181 RepID=A0A4R7UQW7_9PSEU|nr:LCP family protein [Actinophytocola oryzae]TDV36843.1 LytR family transcriptional attenuator [Actinophytocola oryzae]